MTDQEILALQKKLDDYERWSYDGNPNDVQGLCGDIEDLLDERIALQHRLNDAYHQRNMLVLLAAKQARALGLAAGWGFDKKEDWEDPWCYVVYIELPGGGQISYHLAPTEVKLFIDQLPPYVRGWDGTGKDQHHQLITDLKIKRPRIICLCGSTRFKTQYEQANREETLKGHIVLSVGLFGHIEGLDMNGAPKGMLDELHLRKIDLADEVLVLNVGGYIGDSTRREIAYAEAQGKPVRYLEGDF